MSAKDASESGAAAAAAFVAGAQALRRDFNVGVTMRDFDLCYRDGRADEPLEVTHFVDQASLETWKRVGKHDSEAPDLSRVWTIHIPGSERRPDGSSVPSDVRGLRERVRSPLRALEERDEGGFMAPGNPDDKALQELADLGCDIGSSRAAEPGKSGRIELMSSVGGITWEDSVAWAVEHEAEKKDNQEKLKCLPDALRRHLFVLADPSSGSAYFAVRNRQIGRIPVLPSPITTAWVWDGDSSCLFATTPPAAWECHELPLEVLRNPEKWIAVNTD